MDQMDQITALALLMEDLCADGGIRPFDRVKFCTGPQEVWFLWEVEKLVVIVELDADAAMLRAALQQTMAGTPAMN